MSNNKRWLLLWGALSVVLATVLAGMLLYPEPTPLRSVFTPGAMTQGHHGIELACNACHTSRFGGGAVLQQACMNCHGEQLRIADDSHPKSKFTDPRNADLVKVLDARQCVTCHLEHKPDITHAMGVTVPDDFCVTCHADIGKERPTHKDLKFDSCASSGCHNFHDNRALYEDFLLKHLHEPAMLELQRLPARSPGHDGHAQKKPVAVTTPDRANADPKLVRDHLDTAHAKAGVNCSGCHAPNQQPWTDKPDHQTCKSCHSTQVDGFLAGKHGMRLAVGLSAMTPAMAQLPMHASAAHRELSCTSCHGAHRFDTRTAAVESCLGCHADRHSLAFKDSPHFTLLQRETVGALPAGSGLSCASCHMPRVSSEREGVIATHVEHNQSASLRPNDNMIRPVCMQCHGLGFAIDALADRRLIDNNFRGQPSRQVLSLDMAEAAAKADQARRARSP